MVFNAWVACCGTRDPSPSLVIMWVSLFVWTALIWFLSSESEASWMTTCLCRNDGQRELGKAIFKICFQAAFWLVTSGCILENKAWRKFLKENYLTVLTTVSVCDKHPNNQMFLTALRTKQDPLRMSDVAQFRAGLHFWANLLMYVWGWFSGFFDGLKTILVSGKKKKGETGLKLWVLGHLLKIWFVRWGNSLFVTQPASKMEPCLSPASFQLLSSGSWLSRDSKRTYHL